MNFHYCERLDSSFWAEPINAITNIAFLIAAFFAYRVWSKSDLEYPKAPLILTINLAIIGIGSFFWHTMPSPLTGALDVIPILIFNLLYLFYFSRLIAKWSLTQAIAITLSYIALSVLTPMLFDPRALNGSIAYLPVFIYLLMMIRMRYKDDTAWLYTLATIAFAFSIFFRSIDFVVCSYMAIGTHFLWHSLNAIVLYTLIYALIIGLQAQKRR